MGFNASVFLWLTFLLFSIVNLLLDRYDFLLRDKCTYRCLDLKVTRILSLKSNRLTLKIFFVRKKAKHKNKQNMLESLHVILTLKIHRTQLLLVCLLKQKLERL